MRNWAIPILLLIAGLTIWAAPPVATVSSGEDFSLKDAAAPVAGVPFYPVMSGDEVQAGNAPTVLRFKDGSKVTLAPHAKARVEESGVKLAVRLLAGAGTYALSQAGALYIFAGNKAVATTGTTGQVALQPATVTPRTVGSTVEATMARPPRISRRR